MLTEFEINEAKQLKEQIELSRSFFILNPHIEQQMKRLEELYSRCNHVYHNGVCVYCGKEVRNGK